MQENSLPPFRARFIEAVTLDAVLGGLPLELFRPARASDGDRHQLGTRTILPRRRVALSFRNLGFVTAEGLNVVAGLKELIRSSAGDSLISFEFDSDSERMAEVFGVKQLNDQPPIDGVQPLRHLSDSAWTAGPFCCRLNAEKDVIEAARGIAESASLVADNWSSSEIGVLHDAIERIVIEALYNIYEHAYERKIQEKLSLVSFCVQPADRYISKRSYSSSELSWLQFHGKRMVLEIAVSDLGQGVAKTLWLNYHDKHPTKFAKLVNAKSGTREFELARRGVHEQLCLYAFNHESTRKNVDDFFDPYHQLNWRGLFRGRRHIADLGGCVTLTSGRGRAGFATKSDGESGFAFAMPGDNDLIGTTLTLRIPLPLGRRASPMHALRDVVTERDEMRQIELKLLPLSGLVAGRKFDGDGGTRMVPHDLHGEMVGLVLPFRRVTSAHHLSLGASSFTSVEFLQCVRKLNPRLVPIVMFGFVKDAILRVPLESSGAAVGGPRMLAIWDSQTRHLIWKFVGAFDQETESMLDALESRGEYDIPSVVPDVVVDLAYELQANYAHDIVFNESSRRIAIRRFSMRISKKSEEAAFKIAFDQYWPLIEQRVVEDGPVLVHTGRRVSRYLCILYLVESSWYFGEIMGVRLRALIDGDYVVTDDFGSLCVAQTLMRSESGHRTKLGLAESMDCPLGQPVTIFADAIFRGNTVTVLAEILRARGCIVNKIVACVDLREDRGTLILGDIPIHALVNVDAFRTEELQQSANGGADVQIDRVTHVPIRGASSQFVAMASTQMAEDLLKRSESIIEHGFKERGGRLHTIALPVGRLLKSFRNECVDLIVDKIVRFLADCADCPADIVFFFRAESEIANCIGSLHDRLVSKGHIGIGRTYKVALQSEHQGATTLFTHSKIPLFRTCVPVDSGQLLFFSNETTGVRPNGKYLGIYLDDAAVSGKALRSFLYQAMCDKECVPIGLLGVVLVNRLSPVELRAFELNRRLWSPNLQDEVGVPFRLADVFRMQVRSKEGGSPKDHPMIRRVLESGPIPTAELRQYFQAILEKLDTERPVRHIFYVDRTKGKKAVLSLNGAKLRHLFALHQQNEAVLPDLLSCWRTLVSECDPSLLFVLALEPDMLEEAPFNGVCRRDTIRLCVHILTDTRTSEEAKSDALTVLAFYENGFFESIGEVASTIFRDVPLRQQFLLFVLTWFSRTMSQYDKIIEVLSNVREPDADVKWASIAKSLISHSHRFRQQTAALRSEADAEHALRLLLGRMSRHSLDVEEHWESLGNQLFALRLGWDDVVDDDVLADVVRKLRLACSLVVDAFLPAFASLAYLYELKGENSMASRMQQAHEVCFRCVGAIRQMLSVDEAILGRNVVENVAELFESIRDESWPQGWSATDVLSRADIGEDTTPLLKGLRAFYSAPWAMMERMADQLRRKSGLPRMKAAITEELIVCKVPYLDMHEILRPLLDNVAIHGDIGTLTVVKYDVPSCLVIEVCNRIVSRDVGNGAGLVLVRSRAQTHDISIESGRAQMPGDWRAVLTIRHFFRVDAINAIH